MKTYILSSILFVIAMHLKLKAQDYVYRSITFKTNVINLFNIGVEFPVYRRFTADMSGRYFGGIGTFVIPEMTSQRLSLRYHIPLQSSGSNIPSFFFSIGLNNYYSYNEYFPTERNERAVDIFSVLKASIATGFKFRRINIWFAYEPLLHTYQNVHRLYPDMYTYGTPMKETKFRDNIPFAACLAITMMNIRLKKPSYYPPASHNP